MPTSPLERARVAAASGVERIAGFLRPRAASPFAPNLEGQTPPLPPIGLGDQPPPPPTLAKFRPGYDDATLRTFVVPQSIGGWTVERARSAIEQHDQGVSFLESATLAVAATRFAPIFAALRQRVAASEGVPRKILGKARGLPRIVREEVEAQIAPSQGHIPSPYFPEDLWGATIISIAMMGFAVHQHVYGPMGPDGTRPCYTRFWPTSAVMCIRSRRTYQALTTAGPVDIVPDGKWSFFGTTDLPHENGAIRAVGLDYLAGGFTQADMRSFSNRFGNPKPVGMMPEGEGPNTPQGQLMFQAMQLITQPDSYAVVPHGSSVDMLQIAASQTAIFTDILGESWRNVAAAILGSDGTMTKSEGVYTSPGLVDAKYEIVRDDLGCFCRGTNEGRIRPSVQINYGTSIAPEDIPYLDTPLPDPAQDARTKSYAERVLKMHEIIKAETANGCEMTQERADQIAASLSVEAPTIGDPRPEITVEMVKEKLFSPDEFRERYGYDPLPDDAGNVERLAQERLAGKDEAGRKASEGDPLVPEAPPPGEPAVSAAAPEAPAGAPPPEDAPAPKDGAAMPDST